MPPTRTHSPLPWTAVARRRRADDGTGRGAPTVGDDETSIDDEQKCEDGEASVEQRG